ncbi:hypothetical protein [Thiothrix fructosivorans]|uniref:Uncharacterized protein n=1 Tax=Thiothrix fructosivorans TaxID=111770 RepID=A0A8B0SJ36_9GAMM|nr:hypothetical protein [Thiothrix fructosivorans]MBO0611905.1 hypothetical protein [Thiothrix fructosivorans]QTX10450.1 hypothetical protein J1836_018030 [Thiothrix fructosivorans]
MLPFLRLLSLWLFLLTAAYANPLPTDQVPEPLKPWVGWVLDGHKDLACPYLYNAEERQCAWPGRLDLQLTATGGTFTQHWEVYGETQLRLPGDAQHWPQNVHRADNTPLVVTTQDGYPSITLAAGSHDISGQFVWDKLPEALFVAPATGLVQLSVNGTVIATPEFNAAGSLWLSRSPQAASEDGLEVQVFRKVLDSHPLEVTTTIQLRVAGKQRQAELAPVLLDSFIPLHLDSPLPTRMGQDGKLQVQLRPGEWTLKLTGRAPATITALTLPASAAPWPSEEVWVFEADATMRQVQVEGVNSVDPSQTRLPEEWASLPAYLMTTDSKMTLAEQHRGMADSPAQLSLSRQLWLDFDGNGYTLQDNLSGTLAQQSRLEVSPDIRLGRVSIGGQPQLITQQTEGTADGVEVRQRTLNLEADSRYTAARSSPPVSGWQQELQQVTTTLHLPPGWLLFAASGTDNLPLTWLQQWSLLDLFLVLLITVATGYLYGWQWGAVAGVALLLTWHQSDAPQFIWLNLLVVTALLRSIPTGAMQRWLARYRWLSLLVLVLIVLPYTIDTVRNALYPQLQGNGGHVGFEQTAVAAKPAAPEAAMDMMAEQAAPAAEAPMPVPAPAPMMKSSGNYIEDKAGGADSSLAALGSYASSRNAKQQANLREIDPNSMIQTGPGLPTWNWQQVSLQWSGVIQPDERMGLWLIAPLVHSLLKVLGVLVLLVLAARLALPAGKFAAVLQAARHPQQWLHTALLLVVVPWVLALPQPAFAETPPPPDAALLQTLEERLLRAPDCLPDCAQIEQMNLTLGNEGLTIRLRIHAATALAVPVPSSQSTWLPQTVLVDNAPTQALRRDAEQQLWVVLAQGAHDVVLQGSLPTRNSLALPLPLKPRHVTWSGEGWQVDGIRDNGVPEEQLQLNRTTTAASDATLQDMPTLPAFVKIERRLDLGLDWYVTTTIRRVSDSAAPISLAIPLLKGEQPLSEQFTIKDNALQINLKPQQASVEWTSRLPQTDTFTLTASNNSAWLEEWRVAASPVWHVVATGLPVNAYEEADAQGTLLWKPWAGETLTLAVNRPQGVAGQTVTLLASQMQVDVGKRARDVTLRLNLHSSRGSQHSIRLPEGTVLQSLTIDGTKQAIQQQQNTVLLPLLPKKQEAVLEWQEAGALPLHYTFPAVDLGLPSVNAEAHLTVPQDRWVLWAHGPLLGPAVLFWGVLVVLLVLAVLLGRSGITPLKSWQWFLLGVGLSQSSSLLMVLMAFWLIALALRGKLAVETWQRPRWQFNAMQGGLAFLTLIALATLIGAVAKGLLGSPDMQIVGNGSWGQQLQWYQDRVAGELPQPGAISVPIWYYRLLMLAWALWLAMALLGWLRWGWTAINHGGLWQSQPSHDPMRDKLTEVVEHVATPPEA